ncbi:MAG: DNA polymerase III subunit epsilon [SAR116 cluster bacterium]|nr:DNA polymerase III subunit epsilon [SAR116 cluster bacterium]
MREIILDTETTGLSVKEGHRIVEIAACEMRDYILTGKTFHVYVNPEREIDINASNIHGLKTEDLQEKPKFAQICSDLINFIEDSRLVIHNAEFDISFLNNEFEICGSNYRIENNYLDTIKLARKKLPGSLVNLDALCRRYNISLAKREYHGALVDTHLLADVYIELIGGKQTTLELSTKNKINHNNSLENLINKSNKEHINERQFSPNKKELEKHIDFIKDIKNPIWDKYF